jgi:hypothetical protein
MARPLATFFFNSWGGTLGTAATTGLLCQQRMIGDGDCREIGGMKIGKGNRSTRRKTYPSATLSTTNPKWLDLSSNPGRRGGKPATNRLGLRGALTLRLIILFIGCIRHISFSDF